MRLDAINFRDGSTWTSLKDLIYPVSSIFMKATDTANPGSVIGDTQAAIKDGDYALSSQLAQCCCENKVATADLKYSDAMNTASINANTTAQTQKILDALAQNKIDALQAQVTELKTQNMLCGVHRISPYGYGVTPTFANCGCNTVAF